MTFIVHALEGCPYSQDAVQLLAKFDYPRSVTWVPRADKEQYKLKNLWSTETTFPQIFYNKYHIGGFKQLKKLLKVVKTCQKYNLPLPVVKDLLTKPSKSIVDAATN